MILILLGLLIWAGVHLMPSLSPATKVTLQGRLGENGYMGVFSLALFIGLGLIIAGWRGVQPSLVYLPPAELRLPALAIIVVGFLLIGFTRSPGRIRRWVRHPQLTGVALWALAHLMLNGDNRSLLLFGGLLLWCVLEIMAINRREGPWLKPESPALAKEFIGIAVGLVLLAVFLTIHPWIAGMPVL